MEQTATSPRMTSVSYTHLQEINFNEAEKRKDRFLNDVELGRLKQLLEDIRPTDVVLKNLWLFAVSYTHLTLIWMQRYDFMLEYRWKDMLNNNKIAMKIA